MKSIQTTNSILIIKYDSIYSKNLIIRYPFSTFLSGNLICLKRFTLHCFHMNTFFLSTKKYIYVMNQFIQRHEIDKKSSFYYLNSSIVDNNQINKTFNNDKNNKCYKF
jgi:hypothetical protein